MRPLFKVKYQENYKERDKESGNSGISAGRGTQKPHFRQYSLHTSLATYFHGNMLDLTATQLLIL